MSTPKVDAVLVPHMYPMGRVDMDLLTARKKEFGPILGGTPVWSFKVGMLGVDLLVTDPEKANYLFPTNHPTRAGQLRHVWTDRGDGILYGVLEPDTLTPEENKQLIAAQVAEAQAKVAAATATATATVTATPTEAAHA